MVFSCSRVLVVSVCPMVFILKQLEISERRWTGQVRGTESIYWRAVGSLHSLCERAEALGQKWLRGMRSVRALEPPR